MQMQAAKDPTADDFLNYGRFQKLWLKLRNRRLYYQLKYDSKRAWLIKSMGNYAPPTLAPARTSPPVRPTFKHSGNAGDIIYSLPTVKEIAGSAGAHMHFALDVPMREKKLKHPLGGVQLNRKMLEMLMPLLREQDYLAEISVWDGREVDYDLDTFRDAPLMLDRLGICRWYFYMFGIACDLSKPWLKVEPDRGFGESIVVARSERYRNSALSYRFLSKYPKVVFVGLEEEYMDFRQQVPEAEWAQVGDFMEMARIIAGSRLFIGNQSFPFAIAEGLKTRRVVELDPTTPNVVPTGEDGYDVLFQRQLEHVVGYIYDQAP